MAEEPKASDSNVSMQTREMTLNNSMSVASDIPTLGADYVKVAIDADCKLCTFLFFRKHAKPVDKGYGLFLDGLHHEAFLEVKVPFETAFALSLYMNEALKYIRAHPTERGIQFGPTSVRQKPEEKK